MIYRTAVSAALSFAMTASIAAPAFAGDPGSNPLDLTGTWTGTASYKGLHSDGTSFKFTEDITAYIVSADFGNTAMTVESAGGVTATNPRGGDGSPDGFCLLATAAAGKPDKGLATGGVAATSGPVLVYDGDLPIEGVNFKASKIEGSEGKLTGKATFLPWLNGQTGTVTIKLQRTSSTEPVLSGDLLSACEVNDPV